MVAFGKFFSLLEELGDFELVLGVDVPLFLDPRLLRMEAFLTILSPVLGLIELSLDFNLLWL